MYPLAPESTEVVGEVSQQLVPVLHEVHCAFACTVIDEEEHVLVTALGAMFHCLHV